MRIGAATTNGTVCLANDVDPSEVLPLRQHEFRRAGVLIQRFMEHSSEDRPFSP